VKLIQIICLFSLFIYSALVKADAPNATTFTPAQQAQIQTTVRHYLLNNPQILTEMVQRLQDSKLQQAVGGNVKAFFFAAGSPTAGNPKGDVTLIEFFDYQCPHCKHADPLVTQALAADPGLRVIFKQFPIFGAPSEFAARAALAAQQQGKYLAFHTALMNMKGPFKSNTQILDLAKATGLDAAKLQADMNSPAITQEINTNKQLADALNLPGTPAFVIAPTPASASAKLVNVSLIPGDTDLATIKKNIAAARDK
jgi:protein-disulfide isomerase